MAEVYEGTVYHAFFRYRDPETGGRRVAFRGEKITMTKEDYEKGERFGAFTPPTPEPTATPTPESAQGYDAMKVDEAIAFLEPLSAEEREPYFEIERAQDRKGVLAHFDQE